MPRILIAEDEYNIRFLITKILEQLNYEVTAVDNGHAALTLIQQNEHFDVVITDIEMPVLDGMALFSYIQSCVPQTRVILISAYWDRINEATEKGAKYCLPKPFSRQQLLNIIEEAAG
jgi:two-component system, cell cycle response regulator CpdR